MAPRQVAMPVSKFRSGRRARVRLLQLHTTEGSRTMASLTAFLRRGPNASYHAGTDDELIGYQVNRSNEAWHSRGANPFADGFVFCAMAKWSRAEWFQHPVQLENAAWWLASCSRERGVPLRWLSVAETRAAVRDARHAGGVCDHDDYSDATGDGSHWDCGEGLPKDWIIARAIDIHRGQRGMPVMPPNPGTVSLPRGESVIVGREKISGKGSRAFCVPIGTASSTMARAWVQATLVTGKGTVQYFAQNDQHGLHDATWNLTSVNGHCRREVDELRSGTTQVMVHWDLASGAAGEVALEARAK